MTPKEILDTVRRLISEHAAGDADRWWYANRYVFARLQLDERRTKTNIKRQLLDAGGACHSCAKPLEPGQSVHLHRVDASKGYSSKNCALMHDGCHRAHHAKAKPDIVRRATQEAVLVKESKKYEGKSFVYWWDIAPSEADSLDRYEAVEFVKKDSGERCTVPVGTLKSFLEPERRTTRGSGNWGIKVLKQRPDALAFEPGRGKGEWLSLPVVWLHEQLDD